MIRNNVPHFLLALIIFLSFNISYSSQIAWEPAKQGNKVIFIRHSLAPGGGDPSGFKLDDCNTQRNLSKQGIIQSKKIGKLFVQNNIKIDQVLTSQWCRCKDTAKYAFKEFIEFDALNSTFQPPFDQNEVKQIKDLKNFVRKWNGKGKNLVLITHYSIITAVTNSLPKSGEIVITDKKFNVLSTISTN
tara:strand:+ start:2398 stop:2961 length:564 start_codon:yes stop_codon:yes gene_type:complete